MNIGRFGDGFLGWTIEYVVVFDVSGGLVNVCLNGCELGVQALDKLEEFMSIVISTGDICIEGLLEVGELEEEIVNGSGMALLLFEHTREGM